MAPQKRKLQLYLTEEQYQLLKQRAATRGSIAQVVRDLIDDSGGPRDAGRDPFYRHLMRPGRGGGKRYSAEEAKRELYDRPR